MDIQRMEDHMRGGWVFPHGSSEIVNYDDLSADFSQEHLGYDGTNVSPS